MRVTPSLRAASIAADHNSSGMAAPFCRLRLHSSKRALTSSTVATCLFRIVIPPRRSDRLRNELNNYDEWIACSVAESSRPRGSGEGRRHLVPAWDYGRLRRLCERWIYTTCLCFALDLDEQRQSGFRYQYSNYQIEYSRNLLFEIGGHMEQVFQALIDRSRVLDIKTIKTIVGYKHRPKCQRRTSAPNGK